MNVEKFWAVYILHPYGGIQISSIHLTEDDAKKQNKICGYHSISSVLGVRDNNKVFIIHDMKESFRIKI